MDDEAKKIILARRARFVAATIASLGVATHACAGKSVREGDDGAANGGATAGAQTCLSAGGTTNTGGSAQVCLSAPMGGDTGFGGTGGAGGTTSGTSGAGFAGSAAVCLSAPLGGAGGTGPEVCLSGAPGIGDEGGAAGEPSTGSGGASGQDGGGGAPEPCLAPPA